MKIYLDLEQVDTIPLPYRHSTDDIMRISGNNIGNFAFRHALRFLVSDLPSYKVMNWPQARQAAKEEMRIERVILSCANWLGFTEQDERSNLVRAEILESLDAPIVAFGLGAQSPSADEQLQLGPNTTRLAKVISEKSVSISVRDDFTKRLLAKSGIENSVATGCPSNFINQEPDFGAKLRANLGRAQQKKTSLQKFIIGEFSGGHQHSGAVLKKTLNFMSAKNSGYVLQSPVLYPLFLNESEEVPGAYRSNRPEGMSPADLEALLTQKMVGFSSVDAWMDFSRTCDLSFGMRIHGNMIPLQAGVPSVLIAHDSRTHGLADVMSIPRMSLEEFTHTDIENLPNVMLSCFDSGLDNYLDKREILRSDFISYLSENGL